jgi:hypothetical protein
VEFVGSYDILKGMGKKKISQHEKDLDIRAIKRTSEENEWDEKIISRRYSRIMIEERKEKKIFP